MNASRFEDFVPGKWTDDFNSHPNMSTEFECEGYKCEIRRNPIFYSYCGYVTVPENHPDYGKGYDDLTDILMHGFKYSN